MFENLQKTEKRNKQKHRKPAKILKPEDKNIS